MKKIFLFSLLAACTNYLFAQTNNSNNNGQTPPTYQNPYRTNPYSNNPYGNANGNQNIFDKGEKKGTQQSGKEQGTGDKKDNRKNDKKTPLDFRDRNVQNQGKSDSELRELYKNDPDYLKYIGIDPYGSNYEDTTQLVQLDEDDVYGSNFLSNNNVIYDNSSLTSVPEDYRLGVGDEIVVSVWGASEFQSPFTISKDGSIFPNQVGKIFLQGLSFQTARSVIRSKFRKVLPTGSNVDIVLGKVRTIRVYVYDQVKKPGMITMSALNTPINALQMAGGLTTYGNMRNIQVRRNGITIERIDLYEYLKTGNNGREFYMQDNDVITVGLYDKVVTAQGSFKRPMKYQMTKAGTLSDLIELAGGPRFDARESLIRIKTVYNEQEQFIDINGKDFLSDQDYLLRDGDIVNINPINKGVSNVVTVEGAIPYPDQYQIRTGERLFDLIKKAGGLSNNAYRPRAYVFRSGNTTDKSTALKVSIGDYGNDNSVNNILLESGDLVRVLSETQFDEKFYVEVKGLVRKPGKRIFKPNLKLKDLLLMSGGLELDAESGRIEISNITDTVTRYSITGNNVNVQVVSINPDLSIDKTSENLTIKPFDIVYVRKKKENIEQQNILVYGEVDYPGQYSLLGFRERMTSMIRRTGGLTREAFPEGAKLYRKNIGPVVINLKDAMRHAGGKDDIILENGDTIIIPRKIDVVRVDGEVQTPVNIKFDNANRNVMNYIDAAGGFGERPWRKRISVQYQNGRKKRTKNFMFFKFYPKVRPGSVVTVPRRPERQKFDLNAALQYGLTSITSIVTIILLLRSTQ